MLDEKKPNMSIAPWSDDEVASLSAFQASDQNHPFTGPDGQELIPTPNGWVAKEGGPVVQDWAHKWMTDWTWQQIQAPYPTGRSFSSQHILTGALVPWQANGRPVLVVVPGSKDIFLPCFTTEDLLLDTMRKAEVEFCGIKKIIDGRDFFNSAPKKIDDEMHLRMMLDPVVLPDGRIKYQLVSDMSAN